MAQLKPSGLSLIGNAQLNLVGSGGQRPWRGEKFPYQEGVRVLVIFPAPRGQRKGVWQRVKQAMAEEMPDLTSMTADERMEEFTRLSEAVAEHLPFQSLEEFE